MKNFIERWQNRGDEKSETEKFWVELLKVVCKVEEPTEIIEFQKRVALKHVSYIDIYIPSTKIIIEQKSINVDFEKLEKQSDGMFLTAYEQAKRYYDWLPYSQRGRYIIVCNFQEFHIYDMERPRAKPEIIRLEDLEKEAYKLAFLVDVKAKSPRELREEEISIEAGKLIEKLKRSLEKRYENPNNDEFVQKRNERSLTMFCVRLVFLLYAEDSGLFYKRQFHDYLEARKNMASEALARLFHALNVKNNERYAFYFDEDVKFFPYIDGGLFADRKIDIPQLDGEPINIILHEMSEGFNWRYINPTIFGAIFERVLGGDRDTGGMHYTTVENIHKVIDPLFLDDLKAELEDILAIKFYMDRIYKLRDFQDKLASLKFLDPACGSGNFLTESFKSLRTLENKIIRELKNTEYPTGIKVSISQFHGIEVNPFAAAVARTALWISDTQMLLDIDDAIRVSSLPLKEYDHIKEGSAMDKLEGLGWGLPGWKIPHDDMLYIMGNPPFLGYPQQNKGQKEEVKNLFGSGKIDYVACWFAIASEYVQDKKTKAAFVATNSITQGGQVETIFKPLHERWGIEIDFAHQSFAWDSEIKDNKAQVHVVIIGFSTTPPKMKKLYTPEGLQLVEDINFYLQPAPKSFIWPRQEPICPEAPIMRRGSQPTDDGNLILTLEERDKLLKKIPEAAKFIRPFMMGVDFIQRTPRYCLWFVNTDHEEFLKIPTIRRRIKAIEKFRLASKKGATRRKAQTPEFFDECIEMAEKYLAIPVVSSGTREYIPMDWLDEEIIPGNKLFIVPSATLYHFGILTSRVHMAWIRATTGRLKSDYSYSNTVVYNNFVWPSPNKKQKAKIEETAQKILDARAKFPGRSFAELYDDLYMPKELRKAHKANDAAVCAAYGWPKDISESEIIEKLFLMFNNLTARKNF